MVKTQSTMQQNIKHSSKKIVNLSNNALSMIIYRRLE